MKIAGHEVKVDSKDSATVGCTKVSRADVVELLRQMDEKKELCFQTKREGNGAQPGDVWLYVNNKRATLHFCNERGVVYPLITLSKEGLHRSPGCRDTELPVDVNGRIQIAGDV